MVLYVDEHGMKWVTLNQPKVIPIVFYFCCDGFIELYWEHSVVEILPGFTKQTEKRYHSISRSLNIHESANLDMT